jgi:hypothetical protein
VLPHFRPTPHGRLCGYGEAGSSEPQANAADLQRRSRGDSRSSLIEIAKADQSQHGPREKGQRDAGDQLRGQSGNQRCVACENAAPARQQKNGLNQAAQDKIDAKQFTADQEELLHGKDPRSLCVRDNSILRRCVVELLSEYRSQPRRAGSAACGYLRRTCS